MYGSSENFCGEKFLGILETIPAVNETDYSLCFRAANNPRDF